MEAMRTLEKTQQYKEITYRFSFEETINEEYIYIQREMKRPYFVKLPCHQQT